MKDYYVTGNEVYWEDVKNKRLVFKHLNATLGKGRVYVSRLSVDEFKEAVKEKHRDIFQANSPLEAIRIAKILGN